MCRTEKKKQWMYEILLQGECGPSVQTQPSHRVLYQYSAGGLDALYFSAKEVVDAYRETELRRKTHSRVRIVDGSLFARHNVFTQ